MVFGSVVYGPVVCVSGATSTSQLVAPDTSHHRPIYYAAKHHLRTQNITSNFSEARLILPEDGSQRIRNMTEFLSFKILIHVDFNLMSFIQLSALVGK